MKNWEKEFDELIYKISDRGFDGKRSPVLYGDSFNEIKQFISDLLATQKSEMIKEVEGIIGEDEKVDKDNINRLGCESADWDRYTKNKLRAEQRKKLKEL